MKQLIIGFASKTAKMANVMLLLVVLFSSCKKSFEQMTPEEAIQSTITELENDDTNCFSTGVFRNNIYTHAHDYYYIMKLYPEKESSKGKAVIISFLEDKNQEKVDSYVFRYRIEDESSISFMQGSRICWSNSRNQFYQARTVNTHIDGTYKKIDSTIEIEMILGQDRLTFRPQSIRVSDADSRFREKLKEY